MKRYYKKLLPFLFCNLVLIACDHSGYEVSEFTGDYRYYSGIAEFFDCKSRTKFYVADSGINKLLQEQYDKLGLLDKDDVYIRVKGYLKEEKQMDGIDPATVFVAVKLLSMDQGRGCERGILQGL